MHKILHNLLKEYMFKTLRQLGEYIDCIQVETRTLNKLKSKSANKY
jgi:hypothetical protein